MDAYEMQRIVNGPKGDLLSRSPKVLDREVKLWEIPQELTSSFS